MIKGARFADISVTETTAFPMIPADAPSPITVVRSVQDLRRVVQSWRSKGRSVALVPTMGALHQGHLSLVEIAKARADRIIVSIYVNPTQFAPHEDFDSYPRNVSDDLSHLEKAPVHLAYTPSDRDMYPNGFTTRVSVSKLTEGLCAETRPHFFVGVTTVVTKLLLHSTPDIVVFGEKDYQQLLVIKRLVEDLALPVEVLAGPISRESDGLAISSRNEYLTKPQREIASRFNKILEDTTEAIVRGANIPMQIASGEQALLSVGFDRVDYLEVRDASDLTPVENLTAPARLLGAVWLDKTRLIDNCPVMPRR